MKFEISIVDDKPKGYIEGKELSWWRFREFNDKYVALTSSYYYGWFSKEEYEYQLSLLKEELNV